MKKEIGKRNTTVVNAIERKIVITKAFYKKSLNPINPECAELARLMKEYKDFSIELKETTKKTYANLTFAKMEEYIRTQANSEAMLKEFKKVKEVAKAKNQAYAAAKKWFLNTYPEYKEDGVCEKELGETTTNTTEKDNVVSIENARQNAVNE